MNVVITGGAGYIGSHIALSLLERNHQVTVLDNLSNSSPLALKRVERLAGKKLRFQLGDICCRNDLEQLFSSQQFDAVIHMAGLKSVNESLQQPVKYYQNNIAGTLMLLEVMKQHQVRKLIFSSSATVYGVPEKIPLSECCHTGDTTNPYGASKHVVEKILCEVVTAKPQLAITALRYFNPVGAHPSGRIGEHPGGIPNNLLPYLIQVAAGQRDHLPVYGNDYPTPDGTGVRDYIHVMDLAAGHLQALERLTPGYRHYNLGTGRGYSVLEMVKMCEQVSGKPIPLQIHPRRPGDVAICLADVKLAQRELNWRAEHDLHAMVRDAWCWHTHNPRGYQADSTEAAC